MVDRPTDNPGFSRDRFENPETALGGADAVEKTTYVTGSGTDPDARKGSGPSARVSPGGGQGATWAIIIFLIVAAVLVYLLGFGR
jgi:hypothetical protein